MTEPDLWEGVAGDDPYADLPEDGGTGGHLHYQPWLTVAGGPLMVLAEDVFAAIPPPAIGPHRSHRRDATERRRACTYSIVANLAVLALSPLKPSALVISLQKAKRTRYDRAGFTADVLTSCIHALQCLGILTLVPGVFRRTRSRIMLAEGFRVRLVACGASLADIAKEPGGETILLRARKGRAGRTGDLVDYRDDSRSHALRGEMEELNAALNGAAICFDGLPVPPIHMVRIFQQETPEEPPSWSLHGRMYRGEPWLNLPKEQRYRLTLGGSALVDLDYSACFLHLAYAKVGAAFPKGDPYAVEGLEAQRDLTKRLTTSLFFRREAPRRLPKGFKNALPEHWTMARFVEAATALHPEISHLFGTEVGYEFFAMESAIMMAVLRELLRRGIVAMPCHDGLLTAHQHKAEAMGVMRRVSREVLGRELPVAEKPILEPAFGLTRP